MKKDLRHAIDVTFWDKTGDSFMGLHRHTAKVIAIALIGLSVLMASPPTDPTNLFIVTLLKKLIPSASNTLLLIVTHTIIPFLIFLLGIWIYPYNTYGLFHAAVHKVKKYVKKEGWGKIILLAVVGIIIATWMLKNIIGG
jgi:hypothetical protein